MNENWCIFCLAIIKGLTVEQAWNTWEGIKTNCTYTEENIEDMRIMRETMTYKEIGEIYGISQGAVHKRIHGYYKKKNRPTAMVAAM